MVKMNECVQLDILHRDLCKENFDSGKAVRVGRGRTLSDMYEEKFGIVCMKSVLIKFIVETGSASFTSVTS